MVRPRIRGAAILVFKDREIRLSLKDWPTSREYVSYPISPGADAPPSGHRRSALSGDGRPPIDGDLAITPDLAPVIRGAAGNGLCLSAAFCLSAASSASVQVPRYVRRP